jgi:uncharacterized protein
MDIWIDSYEKTILKTPMAVVGSPGMRSIGKLVVDHLVEQTQAKLIAELYSTHLPVIYETKPTFAAHPDLPGAGGVTVQNGIVDLPKVQFFQSSISPIILAKGYHANFEGQYEVAEKVLDFLNELQVRRLIIIAGYGSTDKKICCAATTKELLQEMKQKYDIEPDYKGPFYGFSGLVFGLARIKRIEAVCLFASAEPNPENPEAPDEGSSKAVETTLNKMLTL